MSESTKALTLPNPVEGLVLKNEALSTIYTAFSRERAKTAQEIETLGFTAHSKLEKFNQKVAIAISKLPIDSKGKFPKEGFDGFKTPVEFVQKALGYKPSSAYAIVAYARTQADTTAPDELKKMSIFNHDAVKAANQDELRAAIARGEITSETPQSELRKFAAEHPDKRKNGEVKVVTTFCVLNLSGTDMVGQNLTEDEAVEAAKVDFNKALYVEGETAEIEVIKLPAVKVTDNGKSFTLRRYLFIAGSELRVYVLRPYVKPSKPSKPVVAPTAEEIIVKNTMARRNCSEEDARAFLRENGLID